MGWCWDASKEFDMSDDWACGSRFLKMRMEVVVAFVVWLLRMNICISMYDR